MFWPGDKWRQIEHHVKTKIMSELQDKGFEWAQVKTHDSGRDVLLSGFAPSDEEKQNAIKVASDVFSGQRSNIVARTVQWEGEIKPPVIPLSEGNIQLSIVKGKVSLAGVVASQDEKEQLINAAAVQYGSINIMDQLVVGEHIKPRDNFAELLSSFALNDGVLRLRNGQVTVTAIVESEAIKRSIGENLVEALGREYKLSNRIKVVLPPPPEPDPREICQAKLIEIMSDSKVYFELSKAQIKPDSYPLLDNIVLVLSECSDSSIEVAGHTDVTGTQEFNVILSQARAQAVVNYLQTKGVSAGQLTSQGYGSSRPIQDNKTREGRIANRRIEFIVK